MEIGRNAGLPSVYEKEVLDNGIRLLTENVPGSPSITIGAWVLLGSRVEKEEESGIVHFIEHLLFKGTQKRSAFDLARDIDGVGGILNGFTGEEFTCFYVKVLPEHLDLALDLLSDMLIHSIFNPEELEREREVVLREIKMVEDSPDELVHDLFFEILFPEDSLGRPVTGKEKVIAEISRDRIVDFWRSFYQPRRIILAAAGQVEMGTFRDRVTRYFSTFPGNRISREPDPIRLPEKPPIRIKSIFKPLEEVYLCLGNHGYSMTHPRRYAFQILNVYLGGGMSSRLFQEIREKRGLAYSIYSFTNAFLDTGLLGISLSTSPGQVKECLNLIGQEVDLVKAGEISEEDLHRVKEQIRGNLLLSLEGSDGRMTRLARGEFYFGNPVPIQEVLEGFARVTREEVSRVAQDIFQPRVFSLAALGKLKQEELFIPFQES
ncbi:MAG: pitrilysin family protein [Proteobacteria bacterium]|nr:pitrilysin family protein [Pseudomonadota bacterium]